MIKAMQVAVKEARRIVKLRSASPEAVGCAKRLLQSPIADSVEALLGEPRNTAKKSGARKRK